MPLAMITMTKINSWVSFSFLYKYGALLGGPSGRRSSAITKIRKNGIDVIVQKVGLLVSKEKLFLRASIDRIVTLNRLVTLKACWTEN